MKLLSAASLAVTLVALIVADPARAALQAIEPWSKSSGQLVLAENGKSRMPIVLFEGAPPYIRQAAEELADYIEKTSGGRPELIEGEPNPSPTHAIWVGYQPKLDELFPQIDFDFKHPEEILIAANANHLVIVGRDVWDPDGLVVKYKRTVHGRQQEYGTVNAVYTFLQDGLGVRWLWPGESGEDVLKQRTIAFDPFEYRYHPQIRGRHGLLRYSALTGGGYNLSSDWTRRQRLQLDSLDMAGGHNFSDWWERFHETHPEYFALQPDGTRSAFPSPRKVKLCKSNPAVWHQWLKDVEEQLKKDPGQRVFNASPNDSWASGFCVCDNCRAWDHPDAELRTFHWQGVGQDYPAISDRHVTFANKCAELLKQRYPDKDYYVLMLSYGHSLPAPVKARPADNVIISSVTNFLLGTNLPDRGSHSGVTYKQRLDDWSKLEPAPNLIWRPNIMSAAGWQQGQPDVSFQQVIADMKFAAERNIIGIYIDSVWEHWGTQGPLYYLMGHLTWDPSGDGNQILDDYYQRGFGPAASHVKAYWQLMEKTRESYMAVKGRPYGETYDEAFFAEAQGLLDVARASLVNQADVHLERIAFLQDGLDWTRLLMEVRQLVAIMHQQGRIIPSLDQKLRANWERMEQVAKRANAINWGPVMPHTPRMKMLHPDSLTFDAGTKISPAVAQQFASSASYLSAADAGWELAFSDDFERVSLGNAWEIIDGTWTLEDGQMVGSGVLALGRGHLGDEAVGFQRIEFEATAAGSGVPSDTSNPSQIRVSDLSSFIHANDKADGIDIISTGYFFQFGGYWNTKSQIRKNKVDMKLTKAPASLITSGKTHRIVFENDGGHIKCFVDEKLILDLMETSAIVGKGHDRIGFYFHTRGKLDNVRLYVKKLPNDLDR
jgi:hypothetical protein